MRKLILCSSILTLAACWHRAAAPQPLPPPPDFRVEASTAYAQPMAASNSRLMMWPDETVYFRFGSARLSPHDREALQSVARWMRAHPRRELTIIGHTDRVGTLAYNENLSVRRAAATEAYLEALGISPRKIVIVGRGEQGASGRARPVDRKAVIVGT